jgi:hypothetical protein
VTDEQYSACELIDAADENPTWCGDFLARLSRLYIGGDYHLWQRQRDLILSTPEPTQYQNSRR